jgi:hypothetical protein
LGLQYYGEEDLEQLRQAKALSPAPSKKAEFEATDAAKRMTHDAEVKAVDSSSDSDNELRRTARRNDKMRLSLEDDETLRLTRENEASLVGFVNLDKEVYSGHSESDSDTEAISSFTTTKTNEPILPGDIVRYFAEHLQSDDGGEGGGGERWRGVSIQNKK